jgi:uncharacterized membrane protein YgdD (TMEM256/DUF423 family)
MLIARLAGILLLITLGVLVVMFAMTKDRKWLRIFGRTLAIGIVITLIFIGIYVFERFLLRI